MLTPWMPCQVAGLSSALRKANVLNSKEASEDFRHGISISRRIRNDTGKRNYSEMVLQRIYLEQSTGRVMLFADSKNFTSRHQFIPYSLVDRSHSLM